MLRNLVSSLLQFQQIQTTLIKAKETQKQVERIITLGKKPTKSNWDQVNAYLLVSHRLAFFFSRVRLETDWY